MHCQTCGAAFRGRGPHCAECKKTLSGLSAPKPVPPAFQTPPQPQPTRENRFPADQSFNPPPSRKPDASEGVWDRPTLVRTNVIALALAGRTVKQEWVMGVGTAATALMVANIVLRWEIFWFWLVFPAAILCYIGISLMRKRFFRFAGLFNFESDASGRVYLTTLGGDCPVCQSEVKLKDVGPKRHMKTVIQCTADYSHRWAFDPDRLDKL